MHEDKLREHPKLWTAPWKLTVVFLLVETREKNKQISKILNHIDWDRTKWSLMYTTKPTHSTGCKLEIMYIQPKEPYMNLIFYTACDP